MEVCLRLGVVQITPYVQPALIAPYSSAPKFSLEVEQDLSGQYLVSVFILRAPGCVRRLFRIGGSISWEIGSRMFHGRLSADSFYRSGCFHAKGYPLGQSPWSQTIQGTEFWPLGKVCPGIVLRCLLNLLFCQLKAFLSKAQQQGGTAVPFLCFEGNWLTFFHPSIPLECPDPFTPLL